MLDTAKRPRNSCALHGALQTISEIKGVVPIIHSTSGCAIQSYFGDELNGCSSFEVPSSNITEKQVVFGGSSRLREQIKNTVKVVNGDLYVVLSGCTSELVGDDVIAMTKESQEQGEPTIYYKSPGFKGNVYSGYEGVVKAIITQLPKVIKIENFKEKGVINIFGIIPDKDIHWRGNLEEIRRILEGIGLKVNTLFGLEEDINSWKSVSSAELNIVFSKWGVSIAEKLEEKYETPFISFDFAPVGIEDIKALIELIGKEIEIDSDRANKFINKEENTINWYIDKLVDIYFDYNVNRDVSIIGDESTVIGLSRFLSNSFGIAPKVLIITDSDEERNKTNNINSLISKDTKVYFSEDEGDIKDIIKKNNIELILGSSLEQDIANELRVPLQIVSSPILNAVILNKTYIGLKGAITFLEDLVNIILNHEKKQEKLLVDEIKFIIRSENKVV